ncbi:MAG TPA: type II toxin-antitoxin system HicA family toxin [Methylomirabilota bacterium]|nr:type II toxin-antitoxin system HicA family toxin [Methylomirabilota bacterium]
MKLPRDLRGADLVRILCKEFSYRKVNQEGSHVILQTDSPRSHRLSVPDHNPLRAGTLNAILRAVANAKGGDKAEVLSKL